MTHRSRRPGLTRRRKALYAVAVCVVLFTSAEAALWLAGATPLTHRSLFVREGDRFRTREDLRHVTFNDQTFLASKPPNGYRIFVLGGSSAYGFPRDAGSTFSGQLETLLRESHPDRQIEVVNAAGVSYGMRRVRRVAKELLRHQPDLLIVYSGHNEFVEARSGGAS